MHNHVYIENLSLLNQPSEVKNALLEDTAFSVYIIPSSLNLNPE